MLGYDGYITSLHDLSIADFERSGGDWTTAPRLYEEDMFMFLYTY